MFLHSVFVLFSLYMCVLWVFQSAYLWEQNTLPFRNSLCGWLPYNSASFYSGTLTSHKQKQKQYIVKCQILPVILSVKLVLQGCFEVFSISITARTILKGAVQCYSGFLGAAAGFDLITSLFLCTSLILLATSLQRSADFEANIMRKTTMMEKL